MTASAVADWKEASVCRARSIASRSVITGGGPVGPPGWASTSGGTACGAGVCAKSGVATRPITPITVAARLAVRIQAPPIYLPTLFAHDENLERVRQKCGAPCALRRRRPRGGKQDMVSLFVERDRSSTAFCRHV